MANEGNGSRENKRRSFEEKEKDKLDKKLSLAAQPNSAVRKVNTIETKVLLDIQPSLDYAFSKWQDKGNFDPRYPADKLVGFTSRFVDIAMELNALTEEICAFMGVEYRPPYLIRVRQQKTEKMPEGQQADGRLSEEAAGAGKASVIPIGEAAPAEPSEAASPARKAKKAAEAGS
jgi:hypothetical protein